MSSHTILPSTSPESATSTHGRSRTKIVLLTLLAAGVLATVMFALWVHPFLSVVRPIDADVLVVEGWVPDEVVPGAVTEFKTGRYSHVFVSGMQQPGGDEPGGRVARRLRELGVPANAIHRAPSPFADYHRTANTARGVRQKITELNLKPKGINLVSGGPHSRQSWIAYQRVMRDVSPVGIIAVRKGHYNPSAWWMSKQGLSWVLKDFLGWAKECLVGPRS